MPRKCTICIHKQRAKIEAAMLAPDNSKRSIANRFGVTSSSVQRHKEAHLPATALAQRVEQEQRRGQSLADLWTDLKLRAERLANDAQRAKDRRGETAAIRELIRLVDLGLRAASELRKSESANGPLHAHSDWPGLVAVLASTLTQHPEALDAVRSAFDAIVVKGDV
jgi:hypothetical protein